MSYTDVCPLPNPKGYEVGARHICRGCGKRWFLKVNLITRRKRWVRA